MRGASWGCCGEDPRVVYEPGVAAEEPGVVPEEHGYIAELLRNNPQLLCTN